MKPPILAVGLLLAAATSSPSIAATVHNMETTPQTVSVVENGKTSAMLVAANTSKTDVCIKGCEIKLGVHQLNLKGDETVNINGGNLVVETDIIDDSPE